MLWLSLCAATSGETPDAVDKAAGPEALCARCHKADNYEKAIHVFRAYLKRCPDHPMREKVDFKLGLTYYLLAQEKVRPKEAKEATLQAAEHFGTFPDRYPRSDLRPAALYWAGDAYGRADLSEKSYQMFKRLVWDFPESKFAKFSRGIPRGIFDRIAGIEDGASTPERKAAPAPPQCARCESP